MRQMVDFHRETLPGGFLHNAGHDLAGVFPRTADITGNKRDHIVFAGNHGTGDFIALIAEQGDGGSDAFAGNIAYSGFRLSGLAVENIRNRSVTYACFSSYIFNSYHNFKPAGAIIVNSFTRLSIL